MQHGMGRPPPAPAADHAVAAAEVPLQDRVKEGGVKGNKLARPKEINYMY